MACNKKGRRSSSLPEDILFSEILPYMPAKSAGRCRCVSRSWNRALSSPSFIRLHLQRANRQPKLFFASPSSEPSADRNFYTWQPGDGPAIEKLTCHDLLNPVLQTKTLHGLVLMDVQRPEDQRRHYVCNPSSGAVLPLPDTKEERKMNSQRGTAAQPHPPCYQAVAYGLGYSSASNAYKVVRLFSDDEDAAAAPCCEVFVLGTPAYWRPTAQQPPSCIVDEVEFPVFLNGRLHFLCQYGGILTLDINNETFGSLSLPASCPSTVGLDYNSWVIMKELDGCLCVCHGVDMVTCSYRIWLLRGHEVAQQHWELLCCIDPSAWSEPERMLLQPTSWISPLRMHNVGNGKKKKIMFGTSTCKVLTIDPHVGTPEILYKPEIGISGRFSAPALFEESLVPVGRTIEEMVFSSPLTRAWSDVLKWLPARSVVELSLVCREWRALITTNRFIRFHAIHANLINRPPSLKFVMDHSFGSFVNVDGISPMFLPETTSGRFECSQPCHGLNVGSCNGSEFVCNPAIGYHAFLRDQEEFTFGSIPLGLGYNSDINDHVLVYLSYTKKNFETGEYVMECSMRHLQTRDTEWFKIDPPSRPVADIRPAYVKGKIYWIVEPKHVLTSSAACELVVFNTTMGGKFEVLQGPPCNHDNGPMSVLELHGAICVTCSNRDTDTIDVWMMRDNQVWNVEYCIELGLFLPEYTSDRTTVMGINPVDGRILLSTGRSLGYYDPKTVTLEIIYTLDRPHDDHMFCVIMCQQSLLLPHPQPF